MKEREFPEESPRSCRSLCMTSIEAIQHVGDLSLEALNLADTSKALYRVASQAKNATKQLYNIVLFCQNQTYESILTQKYAQLPTAGAEKVTQLSQYPVQLILGFSIHLAMRAMKCKLPTDCWCVWLLTLELLSGA